MKMLLHLGKVKLALLMIASARSGDGFVSYPVISAEPEILMRSPIGMRPKSLLSSMIGIEGAPRQSPRGNVIEMPFTG